MKFLHLVVVFSVVTFNAQANETMIQPRLSIHPSLHLINRDKNTEHSKSFYRMYNYLANKSNKVNRFKLMKIDLADPANIVLPNKFPLRNIKNS